MRVHLSPIMTYLAPMTLHSPSALGLLLCSLVLAACPDNGSGSSETGTSETSAPGTSTTTGQPPTSTTADDTTGPPPTSSTTEATTDVGTGTTTTGDPDTSTTSTTNMTNMTGGDPPPPPAMPKGCTNVCECCEPWPISWADVPGATHYVVRWKCSINPEQVIDVGDVNMIGDVCNDIDMCNGMCAFTVGYIRVEACNADGCSTAVDIPADEIPISCGGGCCC